MADQAIYISAAELDYISEECRERGWAYVRIDYTNRQIWHDLEVTDMPYGPSFEVPSQEEDMEKL